MKFGVPEQLIAEYLELIGQDAIVAEPEDLPDLPIQDRDDAAIVAAAIGARAEVLVTGDHELQSLKNIGQAKDYFPESLLGRTDGPGIKVWYDASYAPLQKFRTWRWHYGASTRTSPWAG